MVSISWAALNGTKGGQHRQILLYVVLDGQNVVYTVLIISEGKCAFHYQKKSTWFCFSVVKETAKTASYFGVILAGNGVTAVIFYQIF